MAPVQIVLGVEDSQYIELLLRYVRESEYGSKVRIRAFSNIATFRTYMNSGEHSGLVAAEESFLKSWLDSENIQQYRWVCLNEYGETTLEGPSIAKYQPLQSLLEQLCAMTKPTSTDVVRRDNRTIVTMVHSAVPGSGKSITAINMVKQLSMSGHHVFYLNLESASSTWLLHWDQQREQSNGLSRLLYDLQAFAEKKEIPTHLPSSYAIHAEEMKADTFEPPENLNELLRMTAEETQMLIRYLVNSGEYDHIVIDGESSWHERIQVALQESDRVLWLMTDDLPCMNKTAIWMSYWENHYASLYQELRAKTSFVMNKFNGSIVNVLPLEDMQLEGTLAYVPSWKQVTNSELLWCSPIFQRDILKLCQSGTYDIYSTDGVKM